MPQHHEYEYLNISFHVFLIILLAACTLCGRLSGEIKGEALDEEVHDIVQTIELRQEPETQILFVKFKAFDTIFYRHIFKENMSDSLVFSQDFSGNLLQKRLICNPYI